MNLAPLIEGDDGELELDNGMLVCAWQGNGYAGLGGQPTAIRFAKKDPSFNRWVFSNPISGLYLGYILEASKQLLHPDVAVPYVY